MHLLIVQGGNSNVQSLASVLLRNREFNEPRVLTVKQTPHVEYNFTGVSDFLPDCQPSPMTDSGLSSSSTSSSISLGTTSTAIPHLTATILNEVDISADQDEKVKALIEFITSSLLKEVVCNRSGYLMTPSTLGQFGTVQAFQLTPQCILNKTCLIQPLYKPTFFNLASFWGLDQIPIEMNGLIPSTIPIEMNGMIPSTIQNLSILESSMILLFVGLDSQQCLSKLQQLFGLSE
ncbi:UNVERIFIED_CONTAM: hypothetical protein FKN15_068146 [Acipenser sinensis]